MKLKINWRRIYPTIILLAIATIGLGIILYQFSENIVFYYTPTELASKNISENQIVRIGGFVKTGTILKENNFVKFTLTDNTTDIEVEYAGALPNLFRENQGAVAKGHFVNYIFIADEILAKHDEKYMPKEIVEKLKREGNWRD